MKILVIGSNGQLGRSLSISLPRSYPTTIFCDRQAMDLTQLGSIRAKLESMRPQVIINASAYTAVDQAEQETELALAVNRDAVGEIASYCAAVDAVLIHVSTDYVFDGAASAPYVETADTNPRGAYGASKLAGEHAIAASGCRHLIIRTAWVFSPYGQNFLKTMLRLGGEHDTLSVVADQIGSPTLAGDLAEAIVATLKPVREGNCAWGLYHYAGDTSVSWHEFACEIFAQAKHMGFSVPDAVNAISTSEYPTAAPRPAWSVLDSSKFTGIFGRPSSDWRVGIATCLKVLGQSSE
ncbi:MAG: dTDP-4-dehydrorhamnose reductase [Pseudomonadota bacterium]|nr:dTDP-4-dehydrorhamnose reductase [Pseudomonadota bacterium]